MTHTLSGEVIPLSEKWERLPGMQRLITLDGVIYVHQNPKRRRRLAAQAESDVAGADVGVPVEAWEPEVTDESAEQAEVAAVAEAEAEFESGAAPPNGDETTGTEEESVQSAQMAPPPGYALEFGTGRLVPVHSYKGRMSYPSGDWQ